MHETNSIFFLFLRFFFLLKTRLNYSLIHWRNKINIIASVFVVLSIFASCFVLFFAGGGDSDDSIFLSSNLFETEIEFVQMLLTSVPITDTSKSQKKRKE